MSAEAVAEKPLHVQVAEAIGWIQIKKEGHWSWWLGVAPEYADLSGARLSHIPDYTTDWRVTGPLMERYQISVFKYSDGEWAARDGDRQGGDGKTPLLAVCNLLVALGAAGRLTR